MDQTYNSFDRVIDIYNLISEDFIQASEIFEEKQDQINELEVRYLVKIFVLH